MISKAQLTRNSVMMNYITSLMLIVTTYIHLPFFKIEKFGTIVLGLGFLLFYFLEPWAFNFKIRLSRVRVLSELTDGDPKKLTNHKKIGGLVWYGFLIRLVFRFLILIIAFTLLGFLKQIDSKKNEMPNWLLCIYIVAMLFELFLFVWPLFELRLDTYKERTDKKIEDSKKDEIEWRKKNFPLLTNPDIFWKEILADTLLSIYALIVTKFFWNMVNNTFSEYIVSNAKEGSGAMGTAISVIIPVFILALFFLIPVRLAYWVSESIRINSSSEKRHFYFSLFVATIVIMFPTIQTFFKVFGF